MRPDAAELHRQLLDQVSALRTSEEWLEAMVAAASFHDYSLGNWLLLWSQAEQRGTTVTRPAGYRTWQRLGRQVRKGERGYRILAPVTRRITPDDDTEEPDRVVVGFRVVTVFDVAQTDGDPLPDVGPRRLAGDGDAPLLDAAIGMIEDQGYSFALAPLRGPNGLTRPGARDVLVAEDLDGAQITKTTIHELAHVLLHADAGEIDCRGTVEVEAESVAYVVCGAAGLDTSGYSVPYVARWAEATTNPESTLLSTGERIVAASRRILDHLKHSKRLPVESKQIQSSAFVTSLTSDMMTVIAGDPVGTAGKERR